MEIIKGVIPCAKKVVVYGPEGIGKSTFASKFPDPVFIDTEGSTNSMDVARLPKATSWQNLLDQVDYIRTHPDVCKTLVVDTIDWAESMCIQFICDKHRKFGIEDFGYGNGYTYVKEEIGRFLNRLSEVVEAGVNVVLTAHAQIKKFEQPDELGAYDRWELKLGKKTTSQTSPLIKEWADMLLFANYKTVVEKAGSSPNAKNKASGGKRVLYTTHHACWDAKNRFDLPEEVPFDYAAIAACVPGGAPAAVQQSAPAAPAPKPDPEADILPTPQPTAKPTAQLAPPSPMESAEPDALHALGVPEKLADLMHANRVTAEELQGVVGKRGYFPADMPIRDYPADFVEGCLIAAWPQVLQMVLDSRDLPF